VGLEYVSPPLASHTPFHPTIPSQNTDTCDSHYATIAAWPSSATNASRPGRKTCIIPPCPLDDDIYILQFRLFRCLKAMFGVDGGYGVESGRRHRKIATGPGIQTEPGGEFGCMIKLSFNHISNPRRAQDPRNRGKMQIRCTSTSEHSSPPFPNHSHQFPHYFVPPNPLSLPY